VRSYNVLIVRQNYDSLKNLGKRVRGGRGKKRAPLELLVGIITEKPVPTSRGGSK